MVGCSSGQTQVYGAAKRAFASEGAPAAPLDARYRYLRANIDGRVAFLALGYLDQLPEGATEVWYSGSGEVFRLREGRIVGTTGLRGVRNWQAVRYSALPAWAVPPSSTRPDRPSEITRFTRERDLMPGYRMAVRDDIVQTRIAAPERTQALQVQGAGLQWFEERSSTVPADEALPPSRYAVTVANGRAEVLYSEQCLAANFCLSLERWVPHAAAAAPLPTAAAVDKDS
ncbi:hypothetical protein PGB34_03800 [Xenophilus arseniciresistens]|uniref:Group 4 capsule polysaccharide lipoprotein GfcB/YjbF n=1 Tax=Xenophilus arseniciresistens TaxID=1283306 RepID=A0AAE3N5X9_9BURK|nr:hypothetical protein [Xenophilus arseniciresistens]MDA7415478.1 hypothetical protein [Xenophilus arseniciresistens]